MDTLSQFDIIKPTDPTGYVDAMRQSLGEKTFFCDKLPDDVSVFVDFGCADGALLREVMIRRSHLNKHLGGNLYIGYDHDPKMVAEAAELLGQFPEFVLTEHMEDVAHEVARLRSLQGRMNRKVCLILSSVVHEVLSVNPKFEAFLGDVLRQVDPDYIVVRDMAVAAETYFQPSDVSEVAKLHRSMPTLTADFENRHGSMFSRANLIHFMLKVRYPEDWEKEVREDYLPMSAETWQHYATHVAGYSLAFLDHSSSPYLRRYWKAGYGLDIPEATHIRLILKRSTR